MRLTPEREAPGRLLRPLGLKRIEGRELRLSPLLFADPRQSPYVANRLKADHDEVNDGSQ